MSRPNAAVVAVLSLLLFGCSESPSTTTTSSTADTAATSTVDAPPTTSPVDASTESNPPTVESTPSLEPSETKGGADSAQAYMDEMQQDVEASLDARGRPTAAGLDAAIATAKRGRDEFPDDEDLLRALSILTLQSLQVETDEQKLIDRRLELGQLARLLVERNKDNLEEIGNLPNILLLEESKAYIAKEDLAKAWDSLQAARDHGLEQVAILYLDQTFDPIVSNDEYKTKVDSWIRDGAKKQLASFESFPFDFKLRSLTDEGKEVALSDFKGQAVVVDFWGTWCPPCRAALPHLIDLHNEHDGDLTILGINFEGNVGAQTFEEAQEVVQDFLKKEPLPYACLYGENDLTTQVPGFRGFPTMVFVDKAGTVRLTLTGYNPAPMLEAIVEELLAE